MKRAILVSVLLVVAITLHLLTCSWGVRSWAFEAENPPLIRLESCCHLDNEYARERDAQARVMDSLEDENKKFFDKDGHARSDLTRSETDQWFHNTAIIEALEKEIVYKARYALGSFGLWAKDNDTRDTALLLGVFSPILLIVTAVVVVFIPTTALRRRKEPDGQ